MTLEKHFNFENYLIIKSDFIDIEKSIESQYDLLYEDMFQMSSKNNRLTFDLGWYESDSVKGRFICYIIQDFDWENPIYKVEIYDYKDLLIEINKALSFFERKDKDQG